MKKMVAMLKVPVEPIHSAWLYDGFDYPTVQHDIAHPMDHMDIGVLVEDGNVMARLQEEFLSIAKRPLGEDEDENL
ncbi:hypothetical protein EC991_009524 [Linnemannia zychae]|nr:hypothetical protein EC991_009524 [Linnemannia zychae]